MVGKGIIVYWRGEALWGVTSKEKKNSDRRVLADGWGRRVLLVLLPLPNIIN